MKQTFLRHHGIIGQLQCKGVGKGSTGDLAPDK